MKCNLLIKLLQLYTQKDWWADDSHELLGIGVVSDEGEVGESDVELAGVVDSCMVYSWSWETKTIVTLNNAWVVYHIPTRLSRHYGRDSSTQAVSFTLLVLYTSFTLYKLERVINNRAM